MLLPDARDHLAWITDRLEELSRRSIVAGKALRKYVADLRVIKEELHRRSPIRRSPRKSARITDKLRADVRAYALVHPDMSCQEIGVVFNISAGRVSEILAGKRT